MPLSVVVCQWNEGYRRYLPEHVNIVRRMVEKNLSLPHRFVCMTSEADGFDSGVELFMTPPEAMELAKLRSPHGERYPSCYRRLWLFSEDAKVLGERILLLDIDLVITGSLDSLVSRDEDFVGWRPKQACGTRRIRLAGGSWLLRTGTRTQVYEAFNGAGSIAEAGNAGFGGSDQAWISYCLASSAALWHSGVSSMNETRGRRPPEDVSIMHFNGPVKPWDSTEEWVQEFWR